MINEFTKDHLWHWCHENHDEKVYKKMLDWLYEKEKEDEHEYWIDEGWPTIYKEIYK